MGGRLHHAARIAAGAKSPAFAAECNQVLMAAAVKHLVIEAEHVVDEDLSCPGTGLVNLLGSGDPEEEEVE